MAAHPRQQVRFQNTYRLEAKNPFNRDQVEIILKEVMDNHFSKIERFDSKMSVTFCRTVTDEIIDLVKEKNYDRQVKLAEHSFPLKLFSCFSSYDFTVTR